jgi:HD-GYP domain-containing protein (c-di-GMP phosphodiesterase class II)
VARAFGALDGDASFWEMLESATLAQSVGALEPARTAPTAPPSLDDVVLALADFVDLKSKRTAAHSRRTAELAERIARALGTSDDEAILCRRAGLVHDLGQVGVPAFVLDSPTLAPLQRAQLELHAELTGHVLSRTPALSDIAQVAVAHHERLDGSGYPHRLTGAALPRAARILAVADAYDERVRGTEGRAPLTPGEAQRALEGEAGIRLDRDCVRALAEVLADAAKPSAPGAWPGGLTEREVEVLRLAALGLTLKEIALDLSVSPHTARHHLEHIYEKIGVSSRAGAALFAVEHGLVE